MYKVDYWPHLSPVQLVATIPDDIIGCYEKCIGICFDVGNNKNIDSSKISIVSKAQPIYTFIPYNSTDIFKFVLPISWGI